MKKIMKKTSALKSFILVKKLKQEREKYSPKNKERMQRIIDRLVINGFYPLEPTPSMLKYGYTILKMVECYGVNWHIYSGKQKCNGCGVSLKDEKNGPPFKREIAISSLEKDRIISTICPDCGKVLD